MAAETRVIYHLQDQETPYLVRLAVPAQRATLAHFRQVLSPNLHLNPNLHPNRVRFFFKAVDEDVGVVKEEISDDDAKLPSVNGRVVCWIVSSDCQPDFRGSDLVSVATPSSLAPPLFSLAPPPLERTGGIGDSRPPSFHAAGFHDDQLDVKSEVSSSEKQRRREGGSGGGRLNGHALHPADQPGTGPCPGAGPGPGAGPTEGDSSSTQQSSELETTSFCSSEDDDGGRFSQSTEQSGSSPRLIRKQRRRHRRPKTKMEKSASFSSVTDSTMSLNIITVTLNMERYNFLGISIVGQSNDRGDGGIYIGSIMKGGAVAADGRIEPGDMLLQVNDINFENMSNDDAVRVLREVVHQPGPVTLTVAKCWDPSPRGCFSLPRSEPVRPIDPAAWVSHTAAMTGRLLPHYGVQDSQLSVHSDMTAVVTAMANPEGGVEVRDRMWLKVTIPNAFIGSDVVDWLHRSVEGIPDRREARRYAGSLLKAGFIRHTVSKVTFSEQCYYVFGDVCADLTSMTLLDQDEGSGPGPGPEAEPPAFPYQYPVPHPYSSHPPLQLPACGGQRSEGSCSSRSNHSEGGDAPEPPQRPAGGSPPTSSSGLHGDQRPPTSSSGLHGDQRGDFSPVQPEVSRKSFRLAVGNPSDLFLDVM
ncbi:segment polarity protein dishevelled homolog DVL-3-like isoform X2 [Cololabis saira]|uniref:segment polarity protein dishevelled homolog DVL-3-like isoform X2 n=1 Tax=Cololabis saira TaxID=129043 RepID=UPI002AD54598|nr:segment polarity protein dishevelled homolog DVL-3-like isoform X2 [Cololabis saira]